MNSLTTNNSNLCSNINLNKTDSDGILEAMYIIDTCMSANHYKTIEKFDSCASRCMSGSPNRIIIERPMLNPVQIKGFNNTTSEPSKFGLNKDFQEEYYVKDMPSNLTLLCAHAYSRQGCSFLFDDGGLVLKLNTSELHELKDFISKYPVLKHLSVKDRTYQINNNPEVSYSAENNITIPHIPHEEAPPNMDNCNNLTPVSNGDNINKCIPVSNGNINKNHAHSQVSDADYEVNDDGILIEVANSNVATRFFNTKVNVSNSTERILTLLMTGLSFRDWYLHLQNSSLEGIPNDVNINAMNTFEHRYGRTPEIIHLAKAINTGHHKGLMSAPPPLTHVGERYEIDVMESDYNITTKTKKVSTSLNEQNQTNNQRTAKLPSHGGAIAVAVGVDCYSSFVQVKLLHVQINSEVYVEYFFKCLRRDGYEVKSLGADQGVSSVSMFETVTAKVEQLCLNWGTGVQLQISEPYNHSRVTGSVEQTIRPIRELTRLAIQLILTNPNLSVLLNNGFTKDMIYRLWGEFTQWAVVIINLKPCPKDLSKSRYEMYKNVKPNMQSIRILPIGCFVVAIRKGPQPGSNSNAQYGQIGIYVGPSIATPGCIRLAVVSGGHLKILRTSNFNPVSDGGGLNVYPIIQKGLESILSEQRESNEHIISTSFDDEVNVDDGEDIAADLTNQQKTKTKKKNKKNQKNNVVINDNNITDTVNTIPSESLPINSDVIPDQDISKVKKKSKIIPKSVIISQPASKTRFSDRQLERNLRKNKIQGNFAEDHVDLETCCFADWSTHRTSIGLLEILPLYK
jgi:hypothetical protein